MLYLCPSRSGIGLEAMYSTTVNASEFLRGIYSVRLAGAELVFQDANSFSEGNKFC